MTWPSGPLWRALGCLALAALVYRSAPPPDALRIGLALFVLIGGLWMTQALHLSVTALLVPLLAVLAGLMDLRTALASFAHPIIFLFLGGFALAAALQRQGLDQRLAQAVVRIAAGRRDAAVALLFALTALLSMWISNTATTAAMMLPLALGLLHDDDGPPERAFVLLGVAYSASIGGIGTLVASGAIGWPDIEQRTQWGVLLLFGGGLALSEVMAFSGASRFMAGVLTGALQDAPTVLMLLLGVVAFVVFLTELVSNTASAALPVPIFLGVAASLDLPPPLFAAAIAVAASCAFMLPVATPPNAIVYATEQ